MKSTSNTLALTRSEISKSDRVEDQGQTTNERAIDVAGEPNFESDLKGYDNNIRDDNQKLSRKTGGDNDDKKSACSRQNGKGCSDFYVVPLDTPTNYQNHVGFISDSTVIKGTNHTWKQRFRFLICSFAIFSFSLCLASRMALNVAINQMAQGDYTDDTRGSSHAKGVIPMEEQIEHIDNSSHLIKPRLIEPEWLRTKSNINQVASTSKSVKYEHEHGPNSKEQFTSDDDIVTTQMPQPATEKDRWNSKVQHMLMGSFYLGYFPVMLISGYLAEVYGAKTSLFLAAFGSGVINMLTPLIVNQKDLPIIILMILRIALGALQAPVVPSLYALCNVWLSKTEMGIFASFIKVSMGLGVLFGYLIPGLVMMTGCGWPIYFYSEGLICILWSVVWFFLATSKPQDNRFVQSEELQWILRKKPTELINLSIEQNAKKAKSLSSENDSSKSSSDERAPKADGSVINLIIRHPSVWALAITKLTHNIAIDFILIEFPSFMNQAHGVELKTIIVIGCSGSLSLVLLVSLIGWLSKVVVQRKCFGLTKTVWRKVFQSVANFGIASLMFVFAIFNPSNLYVIRSLVIMLDVFYMFGTGGEAVAANDMSIRYPATIYGFAHSISALGGLMVPGLAALVLGTEPKSHERWSIYFYLLGSLAALGGFVFISVFKSKLFLPSEVNYDKTKNSVAPNPEPATITTQN